MARALPAMALCALVPLLGCGGGDADGGSSSATAGAGSSPPPVELAIDERRGKRAKPISIGADGRVFRRREPLLPPPQGRPPAELIVRSLIGGAGPRARKGDRLTVEYVGIHYDGSFFTNSWQRSKPFRFELGAREAFINPGWERGLRGMRIGERRELIVPPKYLYRSGAPPESTPEETLVYVVDLIEIES